MEPIEFVYRINKVQPNRKFRNSEIIRRNICVTHITCNTCLFYSGRSCFMTNKLMRQNFIEEKTCGLTYA
jgi:hypothetical protein